MSDVQDHPKTRPADFSAKRQSHDILITGKATGDYRVESVSLLKSNHQPGSELLELTVKATLGPAENPHPDILKNFDLQFTERPANRVMQVRIVNGHQHFTIDVKP
jgi:hypothetical protein